VRGTEGLEYTLGLRERRFFVKRLVADGEGHEVVDCSASRNGQQICSLGICKCEIEKVAGFLKKRRVKFACSVRG
jgi:hypothetical protein